MPRSSHYLFIEPESSEFDGPIPIIHKYGAESIGVASNIARTKYNLIDFGDANYQDDVTPPRYMILCEAEVLTMIDRLVSMLEAKEEH